MTNNAKAHPLARVGFLVLLLPAPVRPGLPSVAGLCEAGSSGAWSPGSQTPATAAPKLIGVHPRRLLLRDRLGQDGAGQARLEVDHPRAGAFHRHPVNGVGPRPELGQRLEDDVGALDLEAR